MDTIRLEYFSVRPYNRLYVGFAVTESESVRILNGALRRSTHFDGQYEGSRKTRVRVYARATAVYL